MSRSRHWMPPASRKYCLILSGCTANWESRCSMSATRWTKWRAWATIWCCWKKGRVIASGTLSETLSRLDLPTAHLNYAGAVIEAAVSVHDDKYHLTRLDFNGGNLWVSKVERAVGSVVRARVLAPDVSIAMTAPHGSSITNILAARIAEIQDEGPDRVSLRLAVGGEHILLSRITRRSRDQLGLAVGMEVFAQVKSVALIA